MESRGEIEFRYPDGSIVRGPYEQYAKRPLTKSDVLELDDEVWVLRDRKDEDGVTVYVFRPIGDAERLVFEKNRNRQRAASSYRR